MQGSTTMGKIYGGEVRRLHIIYFLSQRGCVQHPHLIRVHHLSRNGVYLRDVKRWMAELRGKDMPEAFAWSYKRRYKNGHVWQDLMDDDLITPICDNEYVLKGSEILPTSSPAANSNAKSKESAAKDDRQFVHVEDDQERVSQKALSQKYRNHGHNILIISSSENCYESPIFNSDSSTLTDDSMKQQHGTSKFIAVEEKLDKHGNLPSSSVYFNLSGYNKNKRNGNDNRSDDDRKTSYKMETIGSPSSSFSLSPCSATQSDFTKSKNHPIGASKLLRNLITCGAVDTNDAALMTVNKYSSNESANKAAGNTRICKGDSLGLSTRVFGTPWNQQEHRQNARRSDGLKQQEQSGFGQPKRLLAAYKPVGAPTCSQCGKSFKPAKLHSHMKSCKGMKTFAKIAVASAQRNSAPSRESL